MQTGQNNEITEIYLDNAATTKVSTAAAAAAYSCMLKQYGNPSSLHRKGLEAEKLVTHARTVFADALSCKPEEIYFTAGSTESTLIAIHGLLSARKHSGKRIVTTGIEHSAVSHTLSALERAGYEIVVVPPREDGHYDAADFAAAVDQNTVLITAMQVNNETGLLLPVEQIGKLCKQKQPDVIFHVDATQALGKMPLSPHKWQVDMMSFSGHKIHAPKGIGALYLKSGLRLESPITGGGQESGIRSGTHNVPGIVGFAVALQEILPQMEQNRKRYESFAAQLREELSDLTQVVFNSDEHCVPWIVNLSVIGYRSEILLHFLEERGIYVSSGSACSVGKKSAVLQNLSFSDARADSALRVSFSHETTLEQIHTFTSAIHEAVNILAKAK